ncbi:MAG: transcriptional regulator [Vicinamibacterales bacterium]|jgi:DNA-binding MarR family transcriptional regulator|nr:transcriptional regulator [Vicinamibacterales bacterium]
MSADPEPAADVRALGGVDRLVHEPGRLMVLACLAVVSRADFLYVQRETGLSQGNLSSHLAKLEAAGYVLVEKTFVGKTPRTTLQLTDRGRDALRAYRTRLVDALSRIPA